MLSSLLRLYDVDVDEVNDMLRYLTLHDQKVAIYLRLTGRNRVDKKAVFVTGNTKGILPQLFMLSPHMVLVSVSPSVL